MRISQLASFLIIGVGIGWLAGLSVTPVIATLLGSLVGLLGGALAGVKFSPARETPKLSVYDARPFSALILGMALAAPAGVYVRANNVLLNRSQAQATTVESDPQNTGLFGGGSGSSTCALLIDEPNDSVFKSKLLAYARIDQKPKAMELIQRTENVATLRELAEVLCAGR